MPGLRLLWCAALAGALGMLPGAVSAQQTGLIESRESAYNNIFVFGDKDSVTMTFGHNRRHYTESHMLLSDPDALTVDYTRLMTVGLAYTPKALRILEIGLGGGRTVSYLNAALPDASIVAVDIDKDVIELAKKYFGFRESANLRAVAADGRSFLMRDKEPWDLILIDAYRGPFVPFHLLTREFYELVKSRLAPGGVVVQNIEPTTMLFDSATTTLNSVFQSVDLYDGGGNVVAVGYDGPQLRQADLLAKAGAAQARYKLRYDLPTMVENRRVLGKPSGKVLTDDFAPVETMRAIEQNNEKWKEQTDAPR